LPGALKRLRVLADDLEPAELGLGRFNNR